MRVLTPASIPVNRQRLVSARGETDSNPISTSPAVSVGMPVYNMAATIREAVMSLLAQTFTDFELLIGDNASTDGTEEICRELAASDTRIRYVRHSENLGPTANFD